MRSMLTKLAAAAMLCTAVGCSDSADDQERAAVEQKTEVPASAAPPIEIENIVVELPDADTDSATTDDNDSQD